MPFGGAEDSGSHDSSHLRLPPATERAHPRTVTNHEASGLGL